MDDMMDREVPGSEHRHDIDGYRDSDKSKYGESDKSKSIKEPIPESPGGGA